MHLPAWLLKSKSKGVRVAKEGGKLGTEDHYTALWQQSQAGFQRETREGHTLYADDLLADFEHRLEDAIWGLQELQKGAGAIGLSEEEAQSLEHYLAKRQQLGEKRHRTYYKNRLKLLCDCRERTANNTTQLSFSEKQVHCELTWQSFDNLVWLVGCGTEEDLSQVVADPSAFAKNRAQTSLVFSDAVPVWLHGHDGRPLVPTSVLEAKQREREAKRKAAAPT